MDSPCSCSCPGATESQPSVASYSRYFKQWSDSHWPSIFPGKVPCWRVPSSGVDWSILCRAARDEFLMAEMVSGDNEDSDTCQCHWGFLGWLSLPGDRLALGRSLHSSRTRRSQAWKVSLQQTACCSHLSRSTACNTSSNISPDFHNSWSKFEIKEYFN